MQVLTRERTFETVEARGANPLLPWGSTVPPTNGQLGMSTAGTVISEKTALQIAAVWGAVSLITDSIATLPIRQHKATGRNTAVEIDPSPVIQQPWAEINQRDFITQGTMSFLLRGNVYGRVAARDERLMYPTQIQLVHPDHAKVRRGEKGAIETYYWNQEIDPDNVTRGMALSLPEGLVGLNPIEYMRNTMGVARAQDLYAGAFYQNSARPDGVIEVPGDLETDEAKAMKNAWMEAHGGINHSHLPAVLTGGAKFTPITMNMEDVQFLEQMGFSQSTISGVIYRVPPHMLGIMDKSTSWGSGIEQQELGFIRNSLLIWLNRWEDLMTSWLPPLEFVTFDLSERLRGDTLQRFAAYQIARVLGVLNNAEIREAEHWPPVTDPVMRAAMENYFQPLNSSPMPAGPAEGGDKAN